jgi:hypothetical protein
MIEVVIAGCVLIASLLVCIAYIFLDVFPRRQRETKCAHFEKRLSSLPNVEGMMPAEASPIVRATFPEAVLTFADTAAYISRPMGSTYDMTFETVNGKLTGSFSHGNGFCPGRPKWGFGS